MIAALNEKLQWFLDERGPATLNALPRPAALYREHLERRYQLFATLPQQKDDFDFTAEGCVEELAGASVVKRRHICWSLWALIMSPESAPPCWMGGLHKQVISDRKAE